MWFVMSEHILDSIYAGMCKIPLSLTVLGKVTLKAMYYNIALLYIALQ